MIYEESRTSVYCVVVSNVRKEVSIRKTFSGLLFNSRRKHDYLSSSSVIHENEVNVLKSNLLNSEFYNQLFCRIFHDT